MLGQIFARHVNTVYLNLLAERALCDFESNRHVGFTQRESAEREAYPIRALMAAIVASLTPLARNSKHISSMPIWHRAIQVQKGKIEKKRKQIEIKNAEKDIAKRAAAEWCENEYEW